LKAIISQRLLRRADEKGRTPAVEVLLSTKLVADMIVEGNLGGVKEAMEKSLAQGSQTFEADIARLIGEGVITRDEGVAFADSPTNLLWRLDNQAPASAKADAMPEPEPDIASFTEITLDVKPEEAKPMFARLGS
jgi:twitching motility protein PilU